ncbi:MAG: hypothetical protein M3O50_04275, partial [Myxococcota bacterium]|nr:hypothetical protein [Myxococcota bacterium]
MDATEAEKFISELELAVDRLRSLYEQYFMGIEKLEPGVARKDVDRRIYALRKAQIRNTAQRFRFQMVLQRYSTFQSHWQRICREIEGGTYKRHVMRARQRFGDVTPAAAGAVPLANAPVTDGGRTAAIAELAELEREFGPPALGPARELEREIERAFAPRMPSDAGIAASRRPGPPPLPARAKT